MQLAGSADSFLPALRTCFVFVLCFVVVQVCVCVADLLDDVVDLVFVSQMTCSLAVISALAAN